MKEYKFILLGFLIIVTVSLFIILKDISSLNEKNNVIVVNIEQLRQRILALEQDKTMGRITALRAENVALKKEIKVLMAELNLESKAAPVSSQPISQNIEQDTKQVTVQKATPEVTIQKATPEVTVQKATPSPGNRGYLKE